MAGSGIPAGDTHAAEGRVAGVVENEAAHALHTPP